MAKLQVEKVELNSAGVIALRNAPGVVADLKSRGDSIKAAAESMTKTKPSLHNGGYYCNALEGKKRAHAYVGTANPYAAIQNARGNILLKALGHGK